MDSDDNWIPEDVARWLDHIGVQNQSTNVPRENEVDHLPHQYLPDDMGCPGYCHLYVPLGGSEGYAYCGQEHVVQGDGCDPPPLTGQYYISTDQESGEESRFGPATVLPPESEMRGSEDVSSSTVLQRLMQEHLRYGSPAGDSAALSGLPPPPPAPAAQASHPGPGPPSPSEGPLQDDPQMVQQSARQEPQGQEHQVDSTTMEKQGGRVSGPLPPPGPGQQPPPQVMEELPSYEEAKAQSQFFRSQQPVSVGPGYYVPAAVAPTAPPSPPPPSSLLPCVSPQKVRTEGRASLSRGAPVAPPHRDEALLELKQGHVRSLSERIMQMTLERNGGRQQASGCGSLPSHASAGRAPKAGLPPTKAAVDPRGPPPEYPFRSKQALPSTGKAPLTSPTEHGLIVSDSHAGGVMDLPKSYLRPQPTKTEITYVRYASPPEYFTRQFPVSPLQQHSPTSSQASTLSASLAPQPALGPAVPQLPGDAFAIVARAQQMVEMLSEENKMLRLEMQGQSEKACRLQRLESEIQKISEAYEGLVKSSAKRESLDKAMKNKLEGEIRRLHDFNRDLRDRLETANRQLASRDLETNEGWPSVPQSRESAKEREKLEMEAASLRSANEDQRRHIEILEQALSNGQGRVVKLEEELRKKQVYVDRVEKLQQALSQLQAACEKREQLERRLRTRLERELESLRTQQRLGGVSQSAAPSGRSAPALMELLREKEERILALEADMTRWEQKYLEESAMRHFAMDAAATAAAQRDTTIINHSRDGSYSDGSLEARIWQEEEEILQANRRCQDMEHRIKNLHAQIIEKDAMIKVLQQRSRKEQGKAEATPLRPARSVPSISAATGLHPRQASQTGTGSPEDRREGRSWKGSANALLGKEAMEALPPPLPAPATASSLPATPLLSAHSKTGSRDSCTQTERSPETQRATSLAGRSRLGNTPSGSPVLHHTLPRGGPESTESPTAITKPTDLKPPSGAGQRPELPDTEVVEILI
ncbi:angiomotin-like protein 1 isoform X1 [Brienomyrus brachyistius]|uniref:angiomotin-like protein 1 isoform X1 n=2 Tax=Brienomyrus brachyistius TaxID=42636 RepID=UPI0020B39D12|nr:angiomotin-like protein 1 isoform X1 [Brienomyrus brachyistius]